MNKYLNLAITLIACIISIPALSQVTIGMGEAPAKTALLQIKDQSADGNNITSKTGGVLLPRVGLINLKTLQPFMDPSDTGYADEKKASIGLFVYNMNKSEPDSIYPGLYYWDGEQWDLLNARKSGGGDVGGTVDPVEPPIANLEDPEALKLSNCYIVGNGSTVDIPVIKGYAVWNQLLNVDRLDLEGTTTVDLLWQDHDNLVTSVSLADGDKGPLSYIRVKVNSQSLVGNAIVTLKINGLVYWSWHIWVTDYDPTQTSGQKAYNGSTFMDRNLGATNATQGNIGSKGLFYQWGRKDPFPGSSTTVSTQEKTLYTIANSNFNILKVEMQTMPAIQGNYIQNAIRNPGTFYFSSGRLGDWYTDDKTVKNDHLWENSDGTKAPNDPCPPGWRVPASGTGDTTPWAGLVSGGNFDAGKGEDYPDAGYYPAAGYRAADTGELISVGTQGNVWYGSALAEESESFRLKFEAYSTLPSERGARASGFSVRCVKE
ncbi:hypothetical protein M2451_000326 [Dysgonomonas sp. PFB1-18]|uniref:hypothetical protein n=1 Tax=unclassified Dysgonomonas TaxID=2630389 RepID=UPI0024750C40|nr:MULTISPECIES: hypothetical protein [unclassified Dysgonomonas]MDH6307877.1 hypothetical protein [Dysgonomonas sp. PF1-14]MDH6337795.1 hypothetical protein [Dysgonomonas sp. PF1-16]MDH6379019.1 hypothetical protein [Dysgonomonas sp. PFB1-18]MDH6396654.1 hypothetical protein [Dysgonomonas sp. PF1-23]